MKRIINKNKVKRKISFLICIIMTLGTIQPSFAGTVNYATAQPEAEATAQPGAGATAQPGAGAIAQPEAYDGFLVRLNQESADEVAHTEVGQLLKQSDYDKLNKMSDKKYEASMDSSEATQTIYDIDAELVTEKICKVDTIEKAEELQKKGMTEYVEPNIILEADPDSTNEVYDITSMSSLISVNIQANTEDGAYMNKEVVPEYNEVLTQNDEGSSQYNGGSWSTQAMNCSATWSKDMTGGGITVAVIDSGVNRFQDEFIQENMLPGKSFINTDGVDDETQANHHGTIVSSLIAGKVNNGNEVDGVAPGVTIMPLRVFNLNNGETTATTNISDVIKSIRYAVSNGADVINMSFGGSGSSLASPSSSFRQACDEASSAGAILISSAGNEGNSKYMYPASYDSVVSVGSVDKLADGSYERSKKSQYNDQLMATAPGGSIYGYTNQGTVVISSGTSFSCPEVAGMAALVKQKNKKISLSGFEEILKESTIDLGTTGRDEDYGYGMIDFSKLYECLNRTRTIKYLDENETETFENEGTTVDDETVITNYEIGINSAIKLPVPSREAYVFKGWYEDSDYSGEPCEYINPGEVTDKKFYAKWESLISNVSYSESGDTIKITFDQSAKDIVAIAAAYNSNGKMIRLMYVGSVTSNEITIPIKNLTEESEKKIILMNKSHIPIWSQPI